MFSLKEQTNCWTQDVSILSISTLDASSFHVTLVEIEYWIYFQTIRYLKNPA